MSPESRKKLEHFLYENQNDREIYNFFKTVVKMIPQLLDPMNDTPLPAFKESLYPAFYVGGNMPNKSYTSIKRKLQHIKALPNNGITVWSLVRRCNMMGIYNIPIPNEFKGQAKQNKLFEEQLTNRELVRKTYEDFPKYVSAPWEDKYFEESIHFVVDLESTNQIESYLIKLRNMHFDNFETDELGAA